MIGRMGQLLELDIRLQAQRNGAGRQLRTLCIHWDGLLIQGLILLPGIDAGLHHDHTRRGVIGTTGGQSLLNLHLQGGFRLEVLHIYGWIEPMVTGIAGDVCRRGKN